MESFEAKPLSIESLKQAIDQLKAEAGKPIAFVPNEVIVSPAGYDRLVELDMIDENGQLRPEFHSLIRR